MVANGHVVWIPVAVVSTYIVWFKMGQHGGDVTANGRIVWFETGWRGCYVAMNGHIGWLQMHLGEYGWIQVTVVGTYIV